MNQYIIANFDRREYLRPEMFGEESTLEGVILSYDGVLCALAVLLSDGNGRGGGDLRANSELIGSWAGCRVAIVDDTATSAELGEPGMEMVPLQRQLLASGKDVSADIFEVIKRGEGDYWACSALNPKHTLSRVLQRKLSNAGGKQLLTAEGRLTKLNALEDLFGIFGVSMGITPSGAARQFQKGLDAMAPAFGLVNPWDVLGARFEMGSKALRTSQYGRTDDLTPVTGITAVHFALRERSTGKESTFIVKLGTCGDSADSVYRRLFPDIRFETAPALTDNIRTPEVARLLAHLKLDDNNAAEA